jgi:hypothetical protein
VSLALGDVVPHITIQSLHLRVGEFESHLNSGSGDPVHSIT